MRTELSGQMVKKGIKFWRRRSYHLNTHGYVVCCFCTWLMKNQGRWRGNPMPRLYRILDCTLHEENNE